MFIRISRLSGAGLIFLLSGCVAGLGAWRSTPVLDGAMSVGVPAGYCIDPSAGREADDRAIVLIGKCDADSAAVPAVLTVAVGAAGSASAVAGGPAMLAEYFTSDQGRRSLSRDGRASAVQVLQAVGSGDALLMRVRDDAVGDYWRAVTGMRGRLVTLSVAGTDGAPLDPEEGRRLLDRSLAALEAANRTPG